MTMEIIPAVDLKGGRCVQLVQGIPGTELVSLDDPIAEAILWIDQGAKTLHLIDLDGAILGERINSNVIENILDATDVKIEVGGGIRTSQDVDDLLGLGVDRVIIGTAAVNNPEFVTEMSDLYGKEHIMVSLDARNGKVTTHGWAKTSSFSPPELGRRMEEMGAGSILFTNIDSEGLLMGVDPNPTIKLIEAVTIPVVASGGVTTVADVRTIKDTGAWAVVIGSALYTGRLSLSDAIQAAIQ
ncbi:MAG TPA: 1-(5-phosphoribosyl)-5-[(5-phosphoribosylamino)methylideneamino]imidazole-4-carboxamide isomerase [Candidatus Nanoarchaeia archaeon]|nr:1-(5-phosphoribosyl)-5-[(5-phosphoribosylamino)methylideneamino]imidazole-4-carboxamide isomerase [Candidatus Nanoarchaeia archaeon]